MIESTEQKIQQKSTKKSKKNYNNGTSYANLHITFSHDIINPQHFGSEPADIRIQIRNNPEIRIRVPYHFYRSTRMHIADYAVARCLSVRTSVCPSVCLSVTRRYCV